MDCSFSAWEATSMLKRYPSVLGFRSGENLRAGKASLGDIICQLSPLCCFEIQPLCARSWRPKIKCVGMSLANNKHVFIL